MDTGTKIPRRLFRGHTPIPRQLLFLLHRGPEPDGGRCCDHSKESTATNRQGCVMSARIASTEVWKIRVEHPNDRVLEAERQSEELGVEYRDTPSPCCETCGIDESAQAALAKISDHRETERLKMVYCDIIGPIPMRTQDFASSVEIHSRSSLIHKGRSIRHVHVVEPGPYNAARCRDTTTQM